MMRNETTPAIDFAEHKPERATEDRVANLDHALRIAAKLTPDARQWTHEAEDVVDCGTQSTATCACGHPIRWAFLLRHADGRTVKIGSVCIESTVPYLLEHGADALAASLQRSLDKLESDKKEHAKRLRDAAASAQVADLEEDFAAFREWISDVRGLLGRRFKPNLIYRGLGKVKAASSPARTASSLRTRYATKWEEAAGLHLRSDYDNDDGFKYPRPPVPTEAKLVKKIAASLGKMREYHEKNVTRYETRGANWESQAEHARRGVALYEKIAALLTPAE